MKEKLGNVCKRWAYLGYDYNVFQEYATQMAQDNLKCLFPYGMCFIAVLAVRGIHRGILFHFDGQNVVPYISTVILTLLLLWARNAFHEQIDASLRLSRFLGECLGMLMFGLTAYVDIVLQKEELDVMICVAIVATCALFDRQPLDTLFIVVWEILISTVLVRLNETSMHMHVGIMNIHVSALIGLLISWHKTKNKLEFMKRWNAELAHMEKEQKTQLMLKQIQPHFLYNVITCIKALCNKDAKLAGEALTIFSRFLRANMDSMSTPLVPFTQELEHIKNFVYLQQMRYDDYLHVSYEIEVDQFKVPSLSIQPLVENAIRYSAGESSEGGNVLVRTYEKEQNYVIEVCDDGVGFGNTQNMGEHKSHVGFENVKNRIQNLSGGTVEVLSNETKGTKVVVEIPKSKAF